MTRKSPTSWPLRPGDLPRAAMARHPELGGLENNALFRYWTWSQREKHGQNRIKQAFGFFVLLIISASYILYWRMVFGDLLKGGSDADSFFAQMAAISLSIVAFYWIYLISSCLRLALSVPEPKDITVFDLSLTRVRGTDVLAAYWGITEPSWNRRELGIILMILSPIPMGVLLGVFSPTPPRIGFALWVVFTSTALATMGFCAALFGRSFSLHLTGAILASRAWRRWLDPMTSRLGRAVPALRPKSEPIAHWLCLGLSLTALLVYEAILYGLIVILLRFSPFGFDSDALLAAVCIAQMAMGVVLGKMVEYLTQRSASGYFSFLSRDLDIRLEEARRNYYESSSSAHGPPRRSPPPRKSTP